MRGNMLFRQLRFEVTEKTRKVALLERMVVEFESMAASLAQQIAAEEERTRIKDPGHMAYSTLAKAVARRRSNLLISVVDVKSKLDVARRELDEVTIQWRALDMPENAAGLPTQAIFIAGNHKNPGPPKSPHPAE